VIVVGVLVALAADDWRDRAATARESREYLAVTRERLVIDTVNATRVVTDMRERRRRMNRVLQVLDGGAPIDADPQEFLLGLFDIYMVERAEPLALTLTDPARIGDPALRERFQQDLARFREESEHLLVDYDAILRRLEQRMVETLPPEVYRMQRVLVEVRDVAQHPDADWLGLAEEARRSVLESPDLINTIRRVVRGVYPATTAITQSRVLGAARDLIVAIDESQAR